MCFAGFEREAAPSSRRCNRVVGNDSYVVHLSFVLRLLVEEFLHEQRERVHHDETADFHLGYAFVLILWCGSGNLKFVGKYVYLEQGHNYL